ncbi:MAG: DNA repair protein RecN, partial [Candidatus Aminicenantes bacterium]
MLDYLKVENFAVVEKVELNFSPHLNILTGETGAGKSILIGAVNHFLKKKVAETAIRGENNTLVVEAMFTRGDEEFILKREVQKTRSLCYINGDLVPFVRLKEKAENLLNIYGQNEHVFLLNPINHRVFLDEFCQNHHLLNRLAESFERLKVLIDELEALKRKGEKAAETLDFINFQITEIENLKMQKGDDEVLEQRLKILSSAEEILSKSHQLIGDFYQKDNSIYNTIADNLKNLRYLKEIYSEMADLSEEVDHFYNLLPELSSTLSRIIGGVDYNEDELNEIEDKLTRLNRLKLKYKMGLDQLLQKKEELVKERNLLIDRDFSVKEMQKDIDKALQEYKTLNLELRNQRKKKAEKLSQIIEKELKKLEMSKARFLVQIEENEPDMDNITDKGTDKIEFYFTSNPGQPPGRIKEIASGGELSRLMLVLKSILKDNVDSTYIFDEIDTGIGGKTAEFVGDKLKRISENNQVICISHLPQIASFAESHFLVSKEFKKNQTFSYVKELPEKDRVAELARLMAGSAVNDDVLKAARQLLTKNQ